MEALMSISRIFTIITLFTITSFNAHAGVEEGDQTLSVFVDINDDSYGTETFVSASGGYFFTDTLELQGVLMFIKSEDEEFGDTSTINGYAINANLYFPIDNLDLIPYIGAGVDLLVFDINGVSENDNGVNAQIGLKHLIKESISIDYQLLHLEAEDYKSNSLSIGFSIFLE